ncbi:MAG: trypsin-like serine protease [Deltaproteobacteria bacterium]|nr:trypsin-like serine protease [Deltaproteobacteria bacterium]
MVGCTKRGWSWSLLLAVALSTSCSAPPSFGEVSAAISGGQATNGHPHVGLLAMQSGTSRSTCTATLIGKRHVLTAAHCQVADATTTFNLDDGRSYSGEKFIPHPDWKFNGDDDDIAVVRLSQTVDLTPAVLADQAPTVGQSLLLVGYGVTMCREVTLSNGARAISCTNDAEVKRQATNSVAEVLDKDFSFNGWGATCRGDSGGPAFATVAQVEVQIGVTSRGDLPCGQRSIDTRVDRYADWIRNVSGGDVRFASDGSPPPPTSTNAPTVSFSTPTAGASVAVGQTTVSLNAAAANGASLTDVALLVDDTKVASKSAAPFDFAVDLSPGKHSLRAVATDDAGRKGETHIEISADPTPARATFGSGCKGPTDCQSGICLEEAGARYCSASCTPTADDCPGSSQCVAADSQYVCAGVALSSEDHRLVSGCAIGASSTRSLPFWALLGLMLLLGRRRGR